MKVSYSRAAPIDPRDRVKPGLIESGIDLANAEILPSAQKFHDLGNFLAAAGTTAASVYTGLKGFLGDG